MITDIQQDKNGYFFNIGKCVYRCDNYDELALVKNELIKEQFLAQAAYRQKIQQTNQRSKQK